MAENTQVFTFESKKQVAVDQFENALRVEAAAEKPVKKVLFVSGMAKILSSEKVGETLSYNGKTSYNIVYESEDGKPVSCLAESEWTNKTGVKEETYFLKPVLVENTVTGSSATEILLSSLINVEISALASEQVVNVEGLDDSYVAAAKVHEYQKTVNTVSDTITEVAEEEVKEKLEDILYSTGEVRLVSATAGIDTITLEGQIIVNAYGLEEGRVVPFTKTLEFKQEVAALSSLPAHKVEASLYLSQLKVTASVGENKTNLIYSTEVHADAVVYASQTATIIEDVFSLNKNLIVDRTCLTEQKFEELGTETRPVVGSFEPECALDEVYFAHSASVVLGEDKEGQVDGFVSVNVLAKTEGGELVSVNGNIPFTAELEKARYGLEVSAMVNNIRLKSASEVEISAEVTVSYRNTTTECVSSVCEIEEQEDKQQKTSAIRVYVVKENEDLFAVAKNLNMRPDAILAQNPGLDEGIEAGTRVVVYCQLAANFN